DSSHRPTFHLSGNNQPSIRVYGSLTIKSINTSGGSNALLLGSQPGSTIDCENVKMTDGGGLWLGSGGKSMTFRNNDVLGKPSKWVYANFSNRVGSVLIDNSGTNVSVPQGSAETAIRVMNVDNMTLNKVRTQPFFKSGKIWKQDIQIRPKSGHI